MAGGRTHLPTITKKAGPSREGYRSDRPTAHPGATPDRSPPARRAQSAGPAGARPAPNGGCPVSARPTPVTEDQNATAQQLLARAATDLAAAQAAAQAKAAQGGTGTRQGVLPGNVR
jgi:hypothetical protein